MPDWDEEVSVVATDNLAGGMLAGEYLARESSSRATPIAILEGVPGVPVARRSCDGHEQGLGDGIKVVGKAADRLRSDKGVNAAARTC